MNKKSMPLSALPISTANLVYHISIIVLFLGAALVLVSGVVLVWTNSIRARSASERISELEAASAQALAATQKAREDEVRTTRLLAEANAKIDAAQKEVAEAKATKSETILPAIGRQITLDNRQLFIDFVKTVDKGRVVVESIQSDTEATSFARQISDMLQGAGYTTVENYGSAVLLGEPPLGVEVRIRSMQEQPLYAGALQRGLEFIGIPTSGSLDNAAGDGVIIFCRREAMKFWTNF